MKEFEQWDRIKGSRGREVTGNLGEGGIKNNRLKNHRSWLGGIKEGGLNRAGSGF